MTCEIIQLSAARPKLAKGERPKIGGLYSPIVRDGEGLTETAKNSRLRSDRLDAWRGANAVMRYWHICMKMESAISYVQRFDVPEGKLHPVREPKDHGTLIERYRLAWCHLMLTPAPDMRSVTWKQAQLKAENYKYTGLPPERIEQAIADDIAFLKAHPTRRSGKQGMDPEKLQKRHAWKAAFRARVTLYAEQNGVDKSELAWLGRIKHEHLVAFADRYGLSYKWLLEGSGTEGRETPTT